MALEEPTRLAGTNTYATVRGSLSLQNHLGLPDWSAAYPGSAVGSAKSG